VSRSTKRRAGATALVAVLLAATAGCTSGDSSSNDGADTGGGTDTGLAAVHLTPLDGAPALRLGEPSPTPLVVNVWATWCVPCRKEMPEFDTTAERYEGEVRFVGVNLGDDEADARRFVTDTGVRFDQYLDPDYTAQAAWSIANMPTTAFVRADGTVAEVHAGAVAEGELATLIERHLGVPPPGG